MRHDERQRAQVAASLVAARTKALVCSRQSYRIFLRVSDFDTSEQRAEEFSLLIDCVCVCLLHPLRSLLLTIELTLSAQT